MKLKPDIFWIALILAFVYLTFQTELYAFFYKNADLELSSFEFRTLANKPFHLEKGRQGYVVYYHYPKDCQYCLTQLEVIGRLSHTFPDLSVSAIVGGEKANGGFGELMTHYGMTGNYLVDSQKKLGKRLGLADEPHLLLFNRDQKLIACLLLNIEHHDLTRHLHYLVDEM